MDEETAGSRVSQYEREVNEPGCKPACQSAAGLAVPEAHAYAIDDDLAPLIPQYHRYKKSNRPCA